VISRSGPIHIIPDSLCTTFLTEYDIKILHVPTISDSLLGVVHTTPLRFIHATKPFVKKNFHGNCHGCKTDLTLEKKTGCSSKKASGATIYWIHAFTLGQELFDSESNPIHTTGRAERFHSAKAIWSIADSSGIV